MKKSFALILLCAILTVVHSLTLNGQDKNADTADPSHIFLAANQAYKEGRYEQAAALYENLLAFEIINGSLCYNLGNSYLKAGKIGKALVNYRRAELFMPRNEDLQANIQYALQQTIDKIEGRDPYSYIKSFCFWYSRLTIKELVTIFLIANMGLWGIALFQLFKTKEYLWLVLYVFIASALLFGVSAAIKVYSFYYKPGGVVTAREITVRSGGSINDTALFGLHEGAEFDWLDESDGWVKIQLRDGKKGWVQKETVEKVSGT
jgi:tetratricopeptide (TPR) repeat protein